MGVCELGLLAQLEDTANTGVRGISNAGADEVMLVLGEGDGGGAGAGQSAAELQGRGGLLLQGPALC